MRLSPYPDCARAPFSRLLILSVTCVLTFTSALPVRATERFVNAAAAPGGNGTAGAPFQTITQAVTASQAGGDIITISSGTYRESVTIPSTKNGTTSAPFTLRAAAGASVVVSGATAVPAASWTVYGGTTIASPGSVFTASAPFAARDLYNSFERLVIARVPDISKPRAIITGWNYSTKTLTLAAPLNVSPSPVMSMFVDVFDTAGQVYAYYPVASVTNNGQTIVLSGTFTSSISIHANDTLLLCNHPSFIKNWKDWAYDKVSATQTTLYYNAVNSSNVRTLQSRQLTNVISVGYAASNVKIQGLEIFGGLTNGIYNNASTNVVIDRCVVHENGTHTGGQGIYLNFAKTATVQNSVITENDHGIVAFSCNGVTLAKCHVAYNDADGIDIGGRNYTPGQALDANSTYNVTISDCYIHNHQSLEHPDNFQAYNGVSGLTINHTYFGLAGQDMMTSDLHQVNVTNSIFFASGARNVILGHGYVSDVSFANTTFGFGRWSGTIGMDASDVANASSPTNITGRGNIIYREAQVYAAAGGGAYYGPFNITFDYNLYWNGTDPIGQTYPYQTFSTPAQVTASTGSPSAGQESHSTLGNPLFMSAPAYQTTVDNPASATTTTLLLTYAQFNTPGGFAVGNTIEIDGDGVARTISARTGNTITFTPALPSRIYRNAMVWDWGTNTAMGLDLRPGTGSPALTGGYPSGPRGSNLNLAQFRQGDYDGDSVRDIPADSANWTLGMTTYKKYPYFGIP